MSQQPHTIEIVITPDGEVKATVQGIKGPSCGEASAFLDRLGEVVEDRDTAEYYEQPMHDSCHNTAGAGGRGW